MLGGWRKKEEMFEIGSVVRTTRIAETDWTLDPAVAELLVWAW